jgi:hypothetical protein
LIDLNSTRNGKSGRRANCVTHALENHGLSIKCVAFSGDNMKTNFGGINLAENQNVFHALENELKKESVDVDAQHAALTAVSSTEQVHCVWTQKAS